MAHILLQLSLVKSQGKSVTLAWISSHVSMPGNETGDAEAKAALSQELVMINVQMSLQQLYLLTRRTTRKRPKPQERGPKHYLEEIKQTQIPKMVRPRDGKRTVLPAIARNKE